VPGKLFHFFLAAKTREETLRKLITAPRPYPETNKNQHQRFAQHIGGMRRMPAGGPPNLAFYDISKELPNGLNLIMTSVSISF
jgi:hypothetical protein